MEKMLEIPHDLKRIDAFKTRVMIVLTVILYIMLARDIGHSIDVATLQQLAP
jgi:hypothetical protein